ncbi:hypothetical protein [Avibacterium sp. 21-599]|uniref:hypothetical protein n=1 Tax=Avibacterium sp. 21-599 TaxID=2911528 RepID=UPI0022477B53|nr:hypothetical protein [Avibacterium sp. 21-599]MCW9719016.1 hypothetical protein [Avibacterium sp. 21-599]
MSNNKLFNSISEKLDDNFGIDNKYIYMVLVLMAINMASIFLPITISNVTSFVLSIVIMILLIQDWNLLKQIDKNTFSKWWSLIPPVYLFKRAKRLETKQTYFQIYTGLWIGFILLFFVFISSKGQLASSACDTVTKIIHEQFHQSTSCKSVSIIESDGKYHSAIAELSNGRTIDVNITETPSGDIYVEIEP